MALDVKERILNKRVICLDIPFRIITQVPANTEFNGKRLVAGKSIAMFQMKGGEPIQWE